MDVRYINPFLNSIRNVFNTMIKVPFNVGKPSVIQNATPIHDVSCIIELSGAVFGCVIINLSKPIALQLTSSLLGDEVTEFNEDCIDAIGEITNMISGNAKKDFPNEEVNISVPRVVIGRQRSVYPSGKVILSIPCETNAGRMTVDVYLENIHVPV